ncbi:MAG: ABC transporter substrate-binding protein, partial [Neofamilia sp.]
MKKLIFIFLVMIMVLPSSACGVNSSQTAKEASEDVKEEVVEEVAVEEAEEKLEEESGTRIIMDQLGNEVEIPNKIERIAIHRLLPLPSVYAAYKGGNVEGLISMPPDSLFAAENSILSKYAPDILEVPIDYYEGGELNMEELLKLKPDVVFYSGSDKEKAQFDAAGIPSVGFSTVASSSVIETSLEWIKLIEEVLQEDSKLKDINVYTKKYEDLINERVGNLSDEEKAKVLVIGHYSDTNLTLGVFGDFWSKSANAIHLGEGATGNVSMEQIYEWNPEKIFVSTLTDFFPEDFYKNELVSGHDWSGIEAVNEEEVYKFPMGMHRWWPPSSDGPLALIWFAKNVYPEQFADVVIEDEVRDYYKNIYGMDLTDEEIHGILNPNRETG